MNAGIMNLRLLQMSDSALPIGGYTHSWGLESAIADRTVRDAESLERWTLGWLKYALGPREGVIVASACRATAAECWGQVATANELLTASLAPPSLRAASREMGEQLLGLASTWIWSAPAVASFEVSVAHGRDWRRWNHAVVFGMLGAVAGGTPHETLLAYFHQAVVGIIGAGVRAVPVGHTHGQQILAYLHEEVSQLAARLCDRELATAGGGGPFYEVLCDEQTRLYTRLFRS
jgi:urease accessory protein